MSDISMYKQVAQISDADLVEKYAPMVKRIGHHLLARLPNNIQIDDLLQAGMIGLLEAAKKYDGSKGASFETYAGIRIRGNMLDEVRKGDWVPRSVHRNAREISKVIHDLENALGRDVRDVEIAAAMEIEVDQYHKMINDSSAGRLFALEDVSFDGEFTGDPSEAEMADPFEGVKKEHFISHLSEAIQGLPEREQLVLSLYYEEEMNLKEIGEILGVSESRVSQISSQAMLRLQARLPGWD